jgi:hypothetical protein
MKSKPKTAEASPVKAVIEELETLRTSSRATIEAYASRLDAEIEQVRATIEGDQSRRKVAPAELRDLRDMLTILRKFAICPEKGRRKDLKKIDSLVGDLTMLIEKW